MANNINTKIKSNRPNNKIEEVIYQKLEDFF